jgi:hypothetical protein
VRERPNVDAGEACRGVAVGALACQPLTVRIDVTGNAVSERERAEEYLRRRVYRSRSASVRRVTRGARDFAVKSGERIPGLAVVESWSLREFPAVVTALAIAAQGSVVHVAVT